MELAKSTDLRPDLYADVLAAGGLGPLIGSAFAKAGSPLRCAHTGEYGIVSARVERAARFAQILIAAKERRFWVQFWAAGVCMASGATADLIAVVGAIDSWLRATPPIRRFATEHKFVVVKRNAEAFENGTAVEQRWLDYLQGPDASSPELAPFVTAAAAAPELRQLFPYISLLQLCFSRCTGYPYSSDCPTVSPAPGGYVVQRRDGSSSPVLTAADAVSDVIAHLPPNCGPARSSTANDPAK